MRRWTTVTTWNHVSWPRSTIWCFWLLLFFVQAVAVLKQNQLGEFKKLGHQNLTKDWTCVNDEFDTRQANVIGSFPLYLKALSRPILSDHPLSCPYVSCWCASLDWTSRGSYYGLGVVYHRLWSWFALVHLAQLTMHSHRSSHQCLCWVSPWSASSQHPGTTRCCNQDWGWWCVHFAHIQPLPTTTTIQTFSRLGQ